MIEVANALISHNPDRADRQLHPLENQIEGEIRVVQWNSLTEEAQGLAGFIKARIEAKTVEAGKVLVLCPTRVIGYEVRDALRVADVRAHSFFQEEILDSNAGRLDECQAQSAYTLLNLLADRLRPRSSPMLVRPRRDDPAGWSLENASHALREDGRRTVGRT
ncbi:MAG TPA: hypothetical protein VIA06_00630 [Candidatus Dormibacteraeota bacterium]|nr:hypothetical protein [Candidatus Dormibacteraeota bacterium]